MTERRPGNDAPSLPLYLTDASRALGEFGLLLAARPLRSTLPRGDGHPVLVLPGLLADDVSTRPLRGILRELGYRAHGWQLGRNIGPTAAALDGMHRRLDLLAARYDAPVTVIGWSLGGIFARNLARRTPKSVRQVITLGSPFRLARHSQSRASRMFDRFAHLHVDRPALPLEGDAGPLPVPTTSIYSRWDGIVAWQACLNRPSPYAENICVVGSHVGLGHHPAVIWAIADRLAQPAGQWTRFRPPLALRPLFPRSAGRST
ncbi:MAG TPA: alpha/beta hydrolase [Jatrophihabitans sp.]|nr:alpha/beta hydrolase [Jatrophihabitans sp.]